MGLSTVINRTQTAGNGTTTAFSFPYYFIADADIVVYETVVSTGVETLQTITTHYTVAGAGVEAGGTITMVTAPPTGTTLTIYRDTAQTQVLDLTENDSTPAANSEQAYDRNTMLIQRLSDRLDRALELSPGHVDTLAMTLPTDVNTADNVLAIDSAGTGWEMKSAADLIGITGALAVTNNLSDLNSVPTALVNLGVNPFKIAVTTSITDSMGATSISGYSFTPGLFVPIMYFVTRNSAAVLGSGWLYLHYDGSAWQIIEGDYNFKSGKTAGHGLTFSMSTNQLQVADADATGSGSLVTMVPNTVAG